mmetsp:Transcript_87387/g.173427  ORF Transcript_87387/g.173427 Transcript_87387/m.173427 type:complete len:82 (-) Transcript_87387:87-332(-)
MGLMLSKLSAALEQPRLKKARSRLKKLFWSTKWLGGNIAWTAVTGAIVLVAPVFIEYERECQMFEQLAQTQSMQMNANPVL